MTILPMNETKQVFTTSTHVNVFDIHLDTKKHKPFCYLNCPIKMMRTIKEKNLAAYILL